MRFGPRHRLAGILTAALVTGTLSLPAAAEDFYAGKSIDFIIGSNPGGGYDIYARALAHHIADHIPGHPSIIAKNMPGAGSAKAAAYMQTLAPKDGTVLGAVFPGAIMDPLLGDRAKAKYDASKFLYVGTADNTRRICITWHTSKTKTFADAQQRKTIIAASQTGGSSRDYAYLHNHLTGTKFNIVSGYKGTVDMLLAIERGEAEGTCGYDWISLQTQRPQWLAEKKINILVQVGLDPEPALTAMGVPQVYKFVKNEDDRKALDLVITQQVFGRPYFFPPGTPADRVKIMRDAFDATMKDPAFLAEAKKLRLAINPISGERIQKLIEDVYASPPAVVERARAAIRP
jgi:tripartite-type tricarboxylate transporter receptor subunit TctC